MGDVVMELVLTQGRTSRVYFTRRAHGTEAKLAGGSTVAGIAISHPEKLLYPEVPLSKLDLANLSAGSHRELLDRGDVAGDLEGGELSCREPAEPRG